MEIGSEERLEEMRRQGEALRAEWEAGFPDVHSIGKRLTELEQERRRLHDLLLFNVREQVRLHELAKRRQKQAEERWEARAK